MSFEITGKLTEKFDVVVVSDKFRKREFVIEVSPDNPDLNFTDLVKFQLTQDKVDLIGDSTIGNDIKVNFNIRGRKWEKDGKTSYFTNLEAWRISNTSDEVLHESVDTKTADQALKEDEQTDDLPF